jgi:hypothetical protein
MEKISRVFPSKMYCFSLTECVAIESPNLLTDLNGV